MSVDKKILEAKTNQELEDYIKPESKYVPEARIYAFEILQSRGRQLTEDEQQKCSALKNEESEHSEVFIHPNLKKAANLIYLSGALGIANMIWTFEKFTSPFAVLVGILVIAFIFVIGNQIEKGNEIARYLFIIIFCLGLIAISGVLLTTAADPVLGILNIFQTVLQLWAVILLIRMPKPVKL